MTREIKVYKEQEDEKENDKPIYIKLTEHFSGCVKLEECNEDGERVAYGTILTIDGDGISRCSGYNGNIEKKDGLVNITE